MTTLKSVVILDSCKGLVAVGNTLIVSNVESKIPHQEIPRRPWVNIQQGSDFPCCAVSENET